jgi:hypothetical protein
LAGAASVTSLKLDCTMIAVSPPMSRNSMRARIPLNLPPVIFSTP